RESVGHQKIAIGRTPYDCAMMASGDPLPGRSPPTSGRELVQRRSVPVRGARGARTSGPISRTYRNESDISAARVLIEHGQSGGRRSILARPSWGGWYLASRCFDLPRSVLFFL